MFLQLAEEKLDLNEHLGDLPPFNQTSGEGRRAVLEKRALDCHPIFSIAAGYLGFGSGIYAFDGGG